jgi:hypothetical protein
MNPVSSTPEERVYASGGGRIVIRWPAPHVIVYVESGFLSAAFVAVINEELDMFVGKSDRPIHVFVDAWELDGYDSEIRIGASRWLEQNRERVAKQHMLVRSRLTRMGLAVAGLMLGGLLQGYTDREAFDASLKEAIART